MIYENENQADYRRVRLLITMAASLLGLLMSFCFGVFVFRGRTEYMIGLIFASGILLELAIQYLGKKRKASPKQTAYEKKWHYEKKCTEPPNGFLAKWMRLPYLDLEPAAGVIFIIFAIFGRRIIPVLKYYHAYWEDRFSEFLMEHSHGERKKIRSSGSLCVKKNLSFAEAVL